MSNGQRDAQQLDYPFIGLEPYLNSEVLTQHYFKHYKDFYLKNYNEAIRHLNLELNDSILDTLKRVRSMKDINPALRHAIINNGSQVVNHEFYWKSMKLDTKPSTLLEDVINCDFGSWNDFRNKFLAQKGEGGSYWTWLVINPDSRKLELVSTQNATNPWLTTNKIPLFVCDDWEHALYLQYKEDRKLYRTSFIDKLVNWDFVHENYVNAFQSLPQESSSSNLLHRNKS